MTLSETPDEIAKRLLEDDERYMDTFMYLGSMAMNAPDQQEQYNFFQELVQAYRNEVTLRQQLQREAESGLYLSGARAILVESKRNDLLEVDRREWQFKRTEVEERSAAAFKVATRYFWYQLAAATAFLIGIAAIGLFFWRPRSFYYEAGQAALWLAGCATILSPLFAWDFRLKENVALADGNRWSKKLDAEFERKGTISN